jgi:hypothetical protein
LRKNDDGGCQLVATATYRERFPISAAGLSDSKDRFRRSPDNSRIARKNFVRRINQMEQRDLSRMQALKTQVKPAGGKFHGASVGAMSSVRVGK